MNKKNKVLVVLVTRNNTTLLNHSLEGFGNFDAGVEYDFVIADNSSDDKQFLNNLDKLSKRYNVTTVPWNRVEASYNEIYRKNNDYKYYFFCHDDTRPNKNNWLKVFVDRINSEYRESLIKDSEFENLPIGRVSACSHYWRNYSSIMNYPISCLFMEDVISKLYNITPPKMFKYCDPERVMISGECLENTNGIFNLSYFKDVELTNPKLFNEICLILSKYLHYYDNGSYPDKFYPKGFFWNKLCLVSEFLFSIDAQIKGWRGVGLEDEGYLEQIHGHNTPHGHKYIHHYGSPNMMEFIAKNFNIQKEDVKKNFNNKIFLMKCDKLIEKYWSNHL